MLNLKESWSPLPKDCLKPADKGLRGRVTGFSLMSPPLVSIQRQCRK